MSVPDGAIPLYFGVLYGVIRVLTLELCTGRQHAGTKRKRY
jgi:hypothetical protein